MIGRNAKGKIRLIFLIAFLVVAGLSSQARAQTGSGRAGPTTRPAHQRRVQDVTSPPASTTQPASYYALVIGNNKYRDPKVNQLKTPVNDAIAVAQLLQDRYGFKTQLLRDATRGDIMTALSDYRTSLTQNSNWVIYYAGHGVLDAGEAYWIPVDGEKGNTMNWISADDIKQAVKSVPSKHVLVISDSCYSGAILIGGRDLESGITPRERFTSLARMQSLKSRNWMASGSVEPVADDGAPGHSIFAGAILQGLGQMKDEQFAASDLFPFVQRKVGGNSPQLPQYGSIRDSGDDLGDFVFSRGGAPLPNPADTPRDFRVTDPAYFGAEGDRGAINAVLHQYEDAFKHRDAAALWKIWPLPPTKRQGIERSFEESISIRMSLKVDTLDIAADGLNAIATGQISETITPKNGSPLSSPNNDITLTFKKNDGAWTIADVK